MKVLLVTFNGRELARTPIHSEMILIGRSPSCDVVLRAKGVKPVQFLMEWTSTGGGPEDGFWSIFDVANTAKKEKAVSEEGTGEGVVLDKKPVKLGQFEFQWKEDRLAHSKVEGGAVADAFMAKAAQPMPTVSSYQLEIVSARADSGSVTQVYHLHPPAARNVPIPLPGLPSLTLSWGLNDAGIPVVIDFSQLKDAEIFKKGVSLSGEGARSTKLAPGDLVQVHFQLKDHYFRLVPKVNVPPVRASLWADAFFGMMVLALLMTAAIGSLVLMISTPEEEPPKEPPRIAQIEIHEPAPRPKPPPPEPVEEAKPEEAKPAPVPEVAGGEASAPRFKSKEPTKKPTPGLNSPAPQANVNSVGLLGALKSKNPNSVKADMVLNDAIISKTVSGKEGNFVVAQSPSGVVRKGPTKTNGDLTAAYTTMNGGDTINEKSSGPIGAKDGKAGYKVGYKKSDGGPPSEGFTAEGGLDKESVRRALAAYRKDIRTCYERALLTKPRIKGRIVYKWQIDGEGPVVWVNLMSQDVGSPSLPPCVQKVIQSIKFPVAPNHQPTIVIYPFEFLPKD